MKHGLPDLTARRELRKWRAMMYARDHVHSCYDNTGVLEDVHIHSLVSVGPLTADHVSAILKDKWIFWERHHHELTTFVTRLNIDFIPKPRKAKQPTVTADKPPAPSRHLQAPLPSPDQVLYPHTGPHVGPSQISMLPTPLDHVPYPHARAGTPLTPHARTPTISHTWSSNPHIPLHPNPLVALVGHTPATAPSKRAYAEAIVQRHIDTLPHKRPRLYAPQTSHPSGADSIQQSRQPIHAPFSSLSPSPHLHSSHPLLSQPHSPHPFSPHPFLSHPQSPHPQSPHPQSRTPIRRPFVEPHLSPPSTPYLPSQMHASRCDLPPPRPASTACLMPAPSPPLNLSAHSISLPSPIAACYSPQPSSSSFHPDPSPTVIYRQSIKARHEHPMMTPARRRPQAPPAAHPSPPSSQSDMTVYTPLMPPQGYTALWPIAHPTTSMSSRYPDDIIVTPPADVLDHYNQGAVFQSSLRYPPTHSNYPAHPSTPSTPQNVWQQYLSASPSPPPRTPSYPSSTSSTSNPSHR